MLVGILYTVRSAFLVSMLLMFSPYFLDIFLTFS